MRHVTVILSALLLLISCGQQASPEPFQSGDLVFVGLPKEAASGEDSMDAAIIASTGDGKRLNMIHVAILEVDPADSLWVIDVTLKHEVSRVPISVLTMISPGTTAPGRKCPSCG